MPQLASAHISTPGTTQYGGDPPQVNVPAPLRPYSALTTGERAVRRAYVQRERARLAARRRAALTRTISAIVPSQRGPHLL